MSADRLCAVELAVFSSLATASLAGLCCATWGQAGDVADWLSLAPERAGGGL